MVTAERSLSRVTCERRGVWTAVGHDWTTHNRIDYCIGQGNFSLVLILLYVSALLLPSRLQSQSITRCGGTFADITVSTTGLHLKLGYTGTCLSNQSGVILASLAVRCPSI